jgi:hypothetical protein
MITVTAYDNTYSCDPDGNTRYRVITGASNLGNCMTFDQNMPGTGCREYRNGGTSNGGCDSGSLIPKSVFLRGGRCVLFNQPGCQGNFADSNGPANSCSNFRSYDGWGDIRSFWCSGCKSSSSVNQGSSLELT